jgi:mono/diheme cytochrome c family protein
MRTRDLGLVTALVFGAFAANAEEVGKDSYDQYCATCHGESAMGDGPLGELMTVAIPDLTTLAQRNDGAFPMLKIIHTIDGRVGLRGHGGPMPVYGAIFKDAAGDAGEYGAEIATRGQVLSIAYYLESLQQ